MHIYPYRLLTPSHHHLPLQVAGMERFPDTRQQNLQKVAQIKDLDEQSSYHLTK
jgi:hypothetical protein